MPVCVCVSVWLLAAPEHVGECLSVPLGMYVCLRMRPGVCVLMCVYVHHLSVQELIRYVCAHLCVNMCLGVSV